MKRQRGQCSPSPPRDMRRGRPPGNEGRGEVPQNVGEPSNSSSRSSRSPTNADEAAMTTDDENLSTHHTNYYSSIVHHGETIAATAQDHIEAAEQAQTYIQAYSGTDSEEDSTFGDAGSSLNTSITSSVMNYKFENGRRYHSFREGRYAFPNDDQEQEREDLKHATIMNLCNHRHYFAPLDEGIQNVLDIGTGTGIWAIEMGDEFPSAQITGIDLSPIQPRWVPPNVTFVVDDAESEWLYPLDHFDYVHGRHITIAIRNFDRLFQQTLRHLKPGGYMELQEIHHLPECSDGTMTTDNPVLYYWTHVLKGIKALGPDPHLPVSLKQRMKDAGFVNVSEEILFMPLGRWPKNKVLKLVGEYWRVVLLEGIEAISLGPITRGLGWKKEQVEALLPRVREGYLNPKVHMFMPLHMVYGQKPPL